MSSYKAQYLARPDEHRPDKAESCAPGCPADAPGVCGEDPGWSPGDITILT